MSLAMVRRNTSMGDLSDFVPANFPEPHNPIAHHVMISPNWDVAAGDGVGDFVLADFPEPHNPITGMGCGGGCGCDSCRGMGAVMVPSWAASLPSPLNQMWGPLPAVYWGIGGIAALLVLPMVFGKRGRR